MDDEVRMLTVKCAEALGYEACPQHDSSGSQAFYSDDVKKSYGEWFFFDPAQDDAQAFELLCWLAERGDVHIHNAIFRYRQWGSIHKFEDDAKIDTPAELRLALMRATVKVHEGRGK